ncbi:MAG TPA: HD domain-containing phosphohydrolase, partial [Nitrospiria bacterium]
ETHADRASLMVFEEDKGKLRVAAHSGFPKIIASKLSVNLGEGVSGTVAKTLKPLIIQGNSDKNPEVSRILKDKSLFSSISVPIIGKGLLRMSSLSRIPERQEHLIGVLNVSKTNLSAPPFSSIDFELVNLLAGQAAMAIENTLLYKELHNNFLKMIRAMVATIELKDPYTAGHSENVSRYGIALAEEMNLPAREVEEIAIGGILHDIGKIGSSEEILQKKGELTPEEFSVIQEHPENAVRILKKVGLQDGILKIILHHHERFNGKGYPHGLGVEEIPLGARIITVADTIDAMTSNRPYRKALPLSRLIQELKDNKGPQFDPEVIEAFERLLKKKGRDFFKHTLGEI